MKSLIFFVLLGVVVSDEVLRLPLTPVESENLMNHRRVRESGFALGPYRARFKRGDAWRINVYNQGDWEYDAIVQIGTPPRSFMLNIDTGSWVTWVNGNDCESGCGSSMNPRYNPDLSSTARTNRTAKFSQTYGNGASFVSGYYVTDTFIIGGNDQPNIVIPDLTFAVVSNSSYGNQDYVGIFALGANPSSPIETAIARGLFDVPIASIYFQKRPHGENITAGAITYGRIETSYCYSVIDWISALPGTEKWQFTASALQIGTWKLNTPVTAQIDTGFTRMSGPRAAIEAIWTQVFGIKLTGSGAYSIPCNDYDYPDFKVVIQGKEYAISAKNYLIDQDDGSCNLAFQYWDSDVWVLGTSWFRQYCTILDYAKNQFGIADSVV